jgi:hypothetical protein
VLQVKERLKEMLKISKERLVTEYEATGLQLLSLKDIMRRILHLISLRSFTRALFLLKMKIPNGTKTTE